MSCVYCMWHFNEDISHIQTMNKFWKIQGQHQSLIFFQPMMSLFLRKSLLLRPKFDLDWEIKAKGSVYQKSRQKKISKSKWNTTVSINTSVMWLVLNVISRIQGISNGKNYHYLYLKVATAHKNDNFWSEGSLGSL